jgi:hypothetical protein
MGFCFWIGRLVSLFGCSRKNVISAKSDGFCFWIRRLGCYYFLVHNDENQNILLLLSDWQIMFDSAIFVSQTMPMFSSLFH